MSTAATEKADLPDLGAVADVGQVVKGPSAIGSDPRRMWRLATLLATTDFKLKFFGSVLGYLWQLVNPLMLFGVLFVVFSFGLSLDAGVKYFPVGLLLGIVLFSFVSETTTNAVSSLVQRETLVRKVDFPRLAVPLSRVLLGILNLALNMVPVLLFLVLSGARPGLSWLLVPFGLIVLVLFSFGMSMILSITYVRYRDVEPIWSVATQVMFYASGVFFTFDSIANREHGQLFVDLMLCSPFAMVLAAVRHWLVDPSWEAPWDAMSSPWLVLIPLSLIALSLIVGALMFRKQSPRVAEDL